MVDITFGYSRSKFCAIADIAVGGVSLSIVQTGAESVVLATGRSALTFEPRTKEQSASMLAGQIKEAGEMALKALEARHRKIAIPVVYAVIHTPWVRTQTVVTSKVFEADTLIQPATLAALAQDALSAAKEINTAQLIEASMSRIEVNGYPTTHPEGTHARTVDAVSLISDCDAAIQASASAALGALFPVAKIVWRTGARAIAAFVDDTALKNKDVLIVDMSTDTTQIIALRKGRMEQGFVSEGIRTILGRLAGTRLPEETLSSVRMLERGACSTEACESIEKAMALAEPELARIFGECIGKMAAAHHVPNDLILITHRDLENWLSRFFTRIDFTQFTLTTMPFLVHTPSTLGIATWIRGEQEEPALAVDTALVNIEAHS